MAPVRSRLFARLASLPPATAAACIALVWGATSLILFLRLGVRLGGDSRRYLDAGQALLDLQPLPGKAASYLGYDLLVAVHLALGGGAHSLVAFQLVVSGLAAWCLYRLGERLYGPAEGLLAALAFSAYVPLRQWDFYVLTDALFVSGAVISVWALLRPSWPAAVPLALFTTLARPNGVIVPAAVALWGARRLWLAGRREMVVAGAGLALALAWPAWELLGAMVAHEQVLEQFASGAIVHDYLDTALAVPAGLVLPAAGGNGLTRIVEFAAANPGYFLALAGAKLGYFLVRARPYFSLTHNLFLLGTLLPAYALAAAGLALRRPRVSGARTLILAMCGLQALIVALTFADRDSRHSLILLPFVFLFAAAGVVRLAGRRTP